MVERRDEDGQPRPAQGKQRWRASSGTAVDVLKGAAVLVGEIAVQAVGVGIQVGLSALLGP